jgi:hypothetical protein
MEKEVSCINSRAVLDYVREHYHGNHASLVRGLDPDIDSSPDPEKFLRDPNNWISSKIASELYERASELFQDDEIAYKIAKHSVERTNLGYAQRIIVKAFGSYERHGTFNGSMTSGTETSELKWSGSKKNRRQSGSIGTRAWPYPNIFT